MKQLLTVILFVLPLFLFSQEHEKQKEFKYPVYTYIDGHYTAYRIERDTISKLNFGRGFNVGFALPLNKIKDNEFMSTFRVAIGYEEFDDNRDDFQRTNRTNTISVGYSVGNEWHWSVGGLLTYFWSNPGGYDYSAAADFEITPFDWRSFTVTFTGQLGVILDVQQKRRNDSGIKSIGYVSPGIRFNFRI